MIHGEWQGVIILEKDKALNIDPKEIRLNFQSIDKYTYQSTLNTRRQVPIIWIKSTFILLIQ